MHSGYVGSCMLLQVQQACLGHTLYPCNGDQGPGLVSASALLIEATTTSECAAKRHLVGVLQIATDR
jgi:hypothetical protein